MVFITFLKFDDITGVNFVYDNIQSLRIDHGISRLLYTRSVDNRCCILAQLQNRFYSTRSNNETSVLVYFFAQSKDTV